MGTLNFNSDKTYEVKNTVFCDGFGTEIVSKKGSELTVNEILEQSKLNFVVNKDKSYDADGNEIGYYHTYYDDENGRHFLGAGLTDQYTVLQNYESFDWLQDIMSNLQIKNAGATNGGKQVYICASTEPIKVLDEEIDPHLVIASSHDGSSSVKIILTPVRVFCSNCMQRASKKAQSTFYIKHSRNVHDRLYIAQDVLLKNTEYLETYKEGIEDMAQVRFSRRQFVDKLIPFVLHKMGLVDENGIPFERKRNANIVDIYRDNLLACWSTEDTKNQENTLVNMWNAITNFESHFRPMRNADKSETTFKRVIAGMTLSNAAIEFAADMVGYKLKF